MKPPRDDLKDRLLDLLLQLPAMDNSEGRTFLLRHLPSGPVSAINRSAAKLIDLSTIIESATAMRQILATGEWALAIVADNAMRLVQGTEHESELRALLVTLREQAPESPPPTTPEIVIGEDARLPVQFLAAGAKAARSVAKLLVNRVFNGAPQRGSGSLAYGTGWLIAPHLLLTNHHVIHARDQQEPAATEAEFRAQAKATMAWFDYLERGGPHRDFASTGIVHADASLDYALLRLADAPNDQGPPISLTNYDNLSIPRAAPVLSRGARLNIIQHGGGGPKQIAIRDNFFSHRVSTEASPDRLRYLTDTEPGASGSPVLTDDWQVIGLHRAWVRVPETPHKGEVITYNNEGVAIHAILNNLPGLVRSEIESAQGWN